MKIGIDISQVIYGTGISTYTENLVKTLLSIDKNNEYILFGGSLRRKSELETFVSGLKGNFSSRIFPIPPTLADILWNRFHFPKIEIFTGKLDVFHSSDWAQPPSKAYKITTIHDLVPLRFPQYSHPRIVSAHKARLNWVKREVDIVIVPSQATKKDLVDAGVSAARIKVIPEAPDPIFKPANKFKVDRLKRKYKIGGKYLLSIGVGPRKNTQRIIEAYEKVKVGRNLKLVVTGNPRTKLEQRRGVRFVGQVPLEELPVLYSGAEVLVYPSIYEGFGLPLLEAFTCKCPVVTSNISSMFEVAAGAAELVDPYSVDSIAQGIKKAFRQRERLVKKGVKRVESFSWAKAAKETLSVYSKIRV